MVLFALKRPPGLGFAAGVALAVLLLATPPAWARRGGIASQGCSGCHSGGTTPTVTITADPAVIMPGQTVTLSVAITTPSVAGLYMTSSVGPLSNIAGEGTTTMSGGITHSTPKKAVGGVATFRVGWTAPATPGGADFIVYAVAGNGDNSSRGDGPGMGFNAFVFGCTGTTFYRDFDGDGVAGPLSGYTKACTQPMYYVLKQGDCNDSDERIYPGAPEKCNRLDDNCDGKIDEGLPIVTYHVDMDGDGHGVATGPTVTDCAPPKGYGVGTDDCDDTKSFVYAGAPELCNYIDDNCNGQVDEGARVACGMGWCRRLGAGCGSTECTPGPPRPEVCNAFDDDCDGKNDNGTDLELCGEPGMACLDGVCVKAGSVPDGGHPDGYIPPSTGTAGTNGAAGSNGGPGAAGVEASPGVAGAGIVDQSGIAGTAGTAGVRTRPDELGCSIANNDSAPVLVLVLVLVLAAVLARGRRRT